MDYNEATYKSKWRIQRFAHHSRYNLAKELCKHANSVLDYGTGSGYFLTLLSTANKLTRLVGYEPVEDMFQKAINETKGFDNIKLVNKLDFSEKFNYISCLEVLEHLEENKQIDVFKDCKKLLDEKGRMIISVPIETGLSGFFKNIFRYLTKHPHAKDITEVLQALFGLKMKRHDSDGYIYSHVGFRHRDLESTILKEGILIRQRVFSPFPLLGSFLNSQVFYIIEFNN